MTKTLDMQKILGYFAEVDWQQGWVGNDWGPHSWFIRTSMKDFVSFVKELDFILRAVAEVNEQV